MEELRIVENIASQFKKTQANLKKCPKTRLTKGYIESKIECINEYWDRFLKAHSSLIKGISKEKHDDIPYLANEEFDTIEELYLCLKADLKDLLERISPINTTQSSSGQQQQSSNMNCAKLPRIELPTFAGNYEDWANYDDLFTSLVHNDKTLSKVQKLHYLKASVTGEAEALLRHIQVTESNYDQAREILKKRYGNKRLIVNSLLKRLFSQKKCFSQTASQIKIILDTTEECLNGLLNEGLYITSWDPIIIYHVVQKLDLETHKDWEEHAYNLKQNELPTWRDLKHFLEGKFRTLELVTDTNSTSTTKEKSQTLKGKSFHVASTSSSSGPTCINCGETHTLSHCKTFSKLQPQERSEFVKRKNLCFNCLAEGHSAWKCRVPVTCRICKKRHHSLLHEKRDSKDKDNIQTHHSQLDDTEDEHKEDEQTDDAIATHFTAKTSTALLATALVPVRDEKGHVTILRALVDAGSQANFISERAAQTLRVKRFAARGNITGVGSTKTTVKHLVQLELLSNHDDTFQLHIKAYVMATQLTTRLPTKRIKTPANNWKHLRGLTLADPNFYEVGKIDLLLGVEVCSQILKSELIKGPPGSPCAQNTSLGWILFGAVQDATSSEEIIVMHHLDIDNMLRNFWEIEPDTKKKYTKEESTCERLYEETYARNEEGRYMVKLPFKSENPKSPEGHTREIAMRRLRQLENRFKRDKTLKEEYTKVLEEYKTLNHLEEVPNGERENPAVYLPHHAVIRQDKDTSKVRIVFDASAKGSNHISLNEELMVGPQLQEDMRSIIMRWRMRRYCYTADVQMMYRQILVTKEDSDYQRILWTDITGKLKDYRLLRVTFGTACAPYLAVKTLQQIAKDEGKQHPVAAKTIHEDFFMDDLMSGSDTVTEAVDTAKNITAILQKGGMVLQKWTSNDTEFLKQVEPSKRSSRVSIDIKVDGTTKALGLSWNMGEDKFQYNIHLPPSDKVMTKRSILAEIQRLFDPLGWLAPALLPAKILIQKLWLKGVGWDDDLDPETKEEWINIRDSYEHLKEIQLNRWMDTTQDNINEVTVHGYCDASIKAYGAVAYLRSRSDDGDIKISLIAAKTRVAPVRPVSLPRLELCGAVLLSQLLKQISEATRIPQSQFYAWTDSTIVLSWLEGDPARWQTFVRNRVITIQDNIGNKWFHVQSDKNPADLASRGVLLPELKDNDLWWQGPDWLKNKEVPVEKIKNFTTELEIRKNYLVNTKIEEKQEDMDDILTQFDNFDTLTELLKTITYCKRFLKYKNYLNKDLDFPMTTEEIENSLNVCIKIVQRNSFEEEMVDLTIKGRVKKRSNLKSLHPYLDSNNILRVGGRIRHANLDESKKHPVIMNTKNALTLLIISDAHIKTLHGGIQLMLTYLRAKYWIINVKRAVKTCIHKCLICAKQSAVARTQLMGDLPKERVVPARPFMNSGVDFAGPYQVLMSRGRGAKTSKGYIAIFVCMATKAIHLEFVGDLTSEAFIGAFKRFVARRGRCTNLWSDQGRNFIGASKELSLEWKEAKLELEGEISEKLALDGTQFHFIPAYSPHYGGLWEAGVKSLKHHLKRILTTHLTYEEMCTVLCQIESCLNSRPLCPVDDTNPDSLGILTPGHFLIGEAPTTVPSPRRQFSSLSYLTRWRYTQKLLNEFWTRWQDEYLSRLQQRPKWLRRVEEFNIGQIVLIKADGLPPGKWLLGRITQKHPGTDGITRVYSVKSGDKIVKRPVTKLCHLPIDTN